MAQGKIDVKYERGKAQLLFLSGSSPVRFLKSMGFKISPDGLEASASASIDKLNFLLNQFSASVTPAALAWQQSQFQVTEELPQIITQDLFDYQVEGVAMLTGNDRAFLAFAPGLGKTVCAVRSADYKNYKHVLIVAPLSLLYTWKKEIEKWSVSPDKSIDIYHGSSPGPKSRWSITNYDTLRNKGLTGKFDLIIFDESILIKNRKALRSQAANQAARKAGAVWLLSGAPVSRYLDDMWYQLHILYSGRFSSYWRFVNTYCRTIETPWSTKIVGNKPHAEERLREDISDIYICYQQDEVLNLPEFIIDVVDVPMTKRQSKVYREMRDTFFAELADKPGESIFAPNVASQIVRLRQISTSPALIGGAASSGKLGSLLEVLEYVEKPVILWCDFTASVEACFALLGNRYSKSTLTGATPSVERSSIVDRFQNDEIEVLIANPQVGKFGLTLTKARTAIYLERSFDSDAYYQSLHRVRRIGTAHNPHIVHLLSCMEEPNEETIDHTIWRILSDRVETVKTLTAGDLLKEMGVG